MALAAEAAETAMQTSSPWAPDIEYGPFYQWVIFFTLIILLCCAIYLIINHILLKENNYITYIERYNFRPKMLTAIGHLAILIGLLEPLWSAYNSIRLIRVEGLEGIQNTGYQFGYALLFALTGLVIAIIACSGSIYAARKNMRYSMKIRMAAQLPE